MQFLVLELKTRGHPQNAGGHQESFNCPISRREKFSVSRTIVNNYGRTQPTCLNRAATLLSSL